MLHCGDVIVVKSPDSICAVGTNALVCAGVALVLLPGGVLLRLVRGSDDLRGVLAIVGISFAAAALVFRWTVK